MKTKTKAKTKGKNDKAIAAFRAALLQCSRLTSSIAEERLWADEKMTSSDSWILEYLNHPTRRSKASKAEIEAYRRECLANLQVLNRHDLMGESLHEALRKLAEVLGVSGIDFWALYKD